MKRAIQSRVRTGVEYRAFQERYWDLPDAFVLECLRWPDDRSPAPYQLEFLRTLATRGRFSGRGPHGLGKTSVAAWAILWFALTRDGQDWKIPTTAGAWRQVRYFLWPEVHKWARMVDWRRVGRPPFTAHELLSLGLNLRSGEAFAAVSDNPALIEGAHADHILYVFDESKSIPAETFDAAEGAFSGGDTKAYALALSTPGEPLGRFYDIQARKPGFLDWSVRHVPLDEAVRSGRISLPWAEARKLQWGEKSAIYQRRVEGNFAADDVEGVIPLSFVEAAVERWHRMFDGPSEPELGPMEALGVDIGLTGAQTVMAPRHGLVVPRLWYLPPADPTVATMVTAGKVKAKLDGNRQAWAYVDVNGIGAGVVHRLAEQKARVVPFSAGARTDRTDKSGELGFANTRAAAWWHMRELLEDQAVVLPDDELLVGDLTTPKYREMSNARLLIESKKDLADPKRLGRSTDSGDAVIQAFYDYGVDEDEVSPEVMRMVAW